MINIITDIEEFFSLEYDFIFMVGAGHYGTKICSFMNRANIKFECFLDNKHGGKGIDLNGKSIEKVEYLNEYKGKKCGLIISPFDSLDLILQLNELDRDDDNYFTCLVPRAKRFDGTYYYDINAVLGYFRKKIINREASTIISNDCVASMIYTNIWQKDKSISPTINIRITPSDYLKIMLNPRYYLTTELKPLGLELWVYEGGFSEVCPVGKINDVKVYFAHVNNPKDELDKCIACWNESIKKIKWNRLVFVARVHADIPNNYLNLMDDCEYPYRIIKMTDKDGISVRDKHLLDMHLNFSETGLPMEEYGFDFIGWYCELLDEIEASKSGVRKA